jgi:hypothetical protein
MRVGAGVATTEPGGSGTAVRITIEFDDGEEITGRVLGEDGPISVFRGRLELYSAIEQGRSRALQGEAADGDRSD